MSTAAPVIARMVEYLDATPAPDGNGWLYTADETGETYRVSADDLGALARYLDTDATTGYSLWCADGHGELA